MAEDQLFSGNTALQLPSLSSPQPIGYDPLSDSPHILSPLIPSPHLSSPQPQFHVASPHARPAPTPQPQAETQPDNPQLHLQGSETGPLETFCPLETFSPLGQRLSPQTPPSTQALHIPSLTSQSQLLSSLPHTTTLLSTQPPQTYPFSPPPTQSPLLSPQPQHHTMSPLTPLLPPHLPSSSSHLLSSNLLHQSHQILSPQQEHHHRSPLLSPQLQPLSPDHHFLGLPQPELQNQPHPYPLQLPQPQQKLHHRLQYEDQDPFYSQDQDCDPCNGNQQAQSRTERAYLFSTNSYSHEELQMDPSHHQMDQQVHWHTGNYQNHHGTSQAHQMLDFAKHRIRTQLQNCVQYQGEGHYQLQQEKVHPYTHTPLCDNHTPQHEVTGLQHNHTHPFSPSHPDPQATQESHTLSAFIFNGGNGQGHTHHVWQQTHTPHMNTHQISQTHPHTHPDPYANHPDVDPQGHPETVSSQLQCSPLGYGSNAAGWGKWGSVEPTSPCVKGMSSLQFHPSNPPHLCSSPSLQPRLCQRLSHYPHSLSTPSPITVSLGVDTQLSDTFDPLISQDQSNDSLNNQAHRSPQPYPDLHHPSSNLDLNSNLHTVPHFHYPPQPNPSVPRDQLACDNPPNQTTHHPDGTSIPLQSSAQVSSSLSQPPLLVPGMGWGTGMGSGPARQKTAPERRGGHVNGNLLSSSITAQTQMRLSEYQETNETQGYRLTCSVCQRDFKSLPALNGHMRSHGGFRGLAPPRTYASVRRKREDMPSNSMVMPVSVPVHSVIPHLPSQQGRRGRGGGVRDEEWRGRKRTLCPPLLLPLLFPSPTTGGAILYHSLLRSASQNATGEDGVFTTGDRVARNDGLVDRIVATGDEEVVTGNGFANDGDGAVAGDDGVVAMGDRVVVTGNELASSGDCAVTGDDGPVARGDGRAFYTPPPMLCPVRKGTGLYCSLTTRGPQRAQTIRLHNTKRSVDDSISKVTAHSGKQPLGINPQINVGACFQAEIPPLEDQRHAHSDSHNALLLWTPWDKLENPVTQQRVEALMLMACSNVLPGGRTSSEYTLHILSECKGDFLMTLEKLLTQFPVRPTHNPPLPYHYTDSDRWTAAEKRLVTKAFQLHHKDFSCIQKTVQTKSLAQCVEFYYTWKWRLRLNIRTPLRLSIALPEENDNVRESPVPEEIDCHSTNQATSLCSSTDLSKTTTNHIESFISGFSNGGMPINQPTQNGASLDLNGPTLTQPRYEPDPEHRISPCPLVRSSCGWTPRGQGVVDILTPSWAHHSGLTSLSSSPPLSSTRLSPSPLVQSSCYPCKECTKVFSKVKSRNAHMKTHNH